MYILYILTAYNTLLCQPIEKPQTLIYQCLGLFIGITCYSYFIHCLHHMFSNIFMCCLYVYLCMNHTSDIHTCIIHTYVNHTSIHYIYDWTLGHGWDFVIIEKHFLCRKEVRCTNEYCTFCSYDSHLSYYYRDNLKLSLW